MKAKQNKKTRYFYCLSTNRHIICKPHQDPSWYNIFVFNINSNWRSEEFYVEQSEIDKQIKTNWWSEIPEEEMALLV